MTKSSEVEMTAKEKVLAMWPDASAIQTVADAEHESYWWIYCGNQLVGADKERLGRGETEDAAWIDAASRLPVDKSTLWTPIAHLPGYEGRLNEKGYRETRPVEPAPQDEELYYIQDKRTYCGNSCFWWKPDGNGYTCNLDEAWKVTRAKAESMMRHRPDVDVAWPVAVIDAGTARHFDMQKLREINPL